MKRLSALLLPALILAAAGLIAVSTGPVSADTAAKEACQGIGLAGGGGGCGDQQAVNNQLSGVISSVVGIMSAVVGTIAVVMIIVAGAKFMTSGGDANAVAGAKKTLTYALIGIAVVALAETIVHFVLGGIG